MSEGQPEARPKADDWRGRTLYTVGHSTRSLDDFLATLRAHGITAVADVRSFPRSRRYPWFNGDALAKSLRDGKMGYVHLPQLGGRRPKSRTCAASDENAGWKEPGFRNFADYMQSPAFEEGMQALRGLVEEYGRVTLLCAEAVPWRCHRRLVADAVTVRGGVVYDVLSDARADLHRLPDFARIGERLHLTYPPPEPEAAPWKG